MRFIELMCLKLPRGSSYTWLQLPPPVATCPWIPPPVATCLVVATCPWLPPPVAWVPVSGLSGVWECYEPPPAHCARPEPHRWSQHNGSWSREPQSAEPIELSRAI